MILTTFLSQIKAKPKNKPVSIDFYRVRLYNNLMESVRVYISAPSGEKLSFSAELENIGTRVKIHGEFDILYDSGVLNVARRGELGYEMTFEKDHAGKSKISTPYGMSEIEYFCKGVHFRKDESGRYVFKVMYKMLGEQNYGVYTIEAEK